MMLDKSIEAPNDVVVLDNTLKGIQVVRDSITEIFFRPNILSAFFRSINVNMLNEANKNLQQKKCFTSTEKKYFS